MLSKVLSINMLFLYEITLRTLNWHNARLLSSNFAIICYVMLPSEPLLPNWLEKVEVESVKLICKCTHVCVYQWIRMKLKTGNGLMAGR